MDLWRFLALVAFVGLYFRASARHHDFRQVARVEHKLDIILKYWGLEADLEAEVPAHVHELAQMRNGGAES
jgi:hypothetical protein